MKPPYKYRYKFWNYPWLTICLACILMTVTTAAIAEYKKPSQTSAPNSRTTTSSASRGACLNQNNTQLTAIAPYSHVGQTTSTHPTFSWFVPDDEYFPLEFHLIEETHNTHPKTIYKQNLSSSLGMMYLTLPSSQPDLAVGKKYHWQVIMRCTRYKAVVTMADIEVITPKKEFQATLNKTSGIARRADLYAQAGLWYDALEISLQAPEFQRTELQNKLIQELVVLERNYNIASVQEQGEKLARINDYISRVSVSVREANTMRKRDPLNNY
ncbi:MAG: hypothetical protein RLZZ535_292 [Cyanobacteriota bacterium]|jgi:hypothetical protein